MERVKDAFVRGKAMSTLANLLARKQHLLERLHAGPCPNERAEIEALLAQIEAALGLLQEPGETSDEQ